MKLKEYSFSEKYRYFCAMSRPGTKKKNGSIVSDFERGRYFERALMMRKSAEEYKKNKNNINKKSDKSLSMNIRNYTDEELDSLFDNFKEFKVD